MNAITMIRPSDQETIASYRSVLRSGPITRTRLVRSLCVYLACVALGTVPLILGMSAGWQAAGMGLWFPGAGFVAVGGWAWLLVPLSLAVFAAAIFFWFGAGMIVLPPLVWLAAAVGAGALAGEAIWGPAPLVDAALLGVAAALRYRASTRKRAADRKTFERRHAALPAALPAARAAAVAAPSPSERELDTDQVAALRYAIDRGLQPLDRWDGFDRVEEFQTAARRYQINYLGYAIATAQHFYTPSFHGYQAAAQRGLIERYQLPEVWRYWLYETAWGHLNVTNFDPAARDNIMLTGFFGQQLSLYTSGTGDQRYTKPGSIVFSNGKLHYAHDVHSIAKSVADNFRRAAFCLYPCEPNWVYPICNHYGMVSLVIHDRLFGTDYAEKILPGWLDAINAEFTDATGSVVGLRSEITGVEFKFPSGDAGLAPFSNVFAPGRAERQWATARSELQFLLSGDGDERRLRIPGRGFDPGNYRPGHMGSYGGISIAAGEFGDVELQRAALRAMDEDGGRTSEGGVLRYLNASNQANAFQIMGRLRRKDDWRNAMTKGPPASVFAGPLLSEARYPDVLVAHAFSGGEDLSLVLYPGRLSGPQRLTISRLRPGHDYIVKGSANDGVTLRSDAHGMADVTVALDGRTALRVVPAA